MSGDDDRRELGHAPTLLSDLPPRPSAAPRDIGDLSAPPDGVTLPSVGNAATWEPSTGATRIVTTEEPFGKETLASSDAIRPKAAGDVHIGQVLAGKYELERLLGQGGMGKVYKGTHLGLGIPIAVKTMHPEIAGTPDYVRRFRHEAHAASLLNHPNAVRVLDFGDEHGILYLVMEYLEGRSLTRWLGEHLAPPPLAEVVSLLAMLLDAFQVAHSFGIVHRDLKPDNVFLTSMPGHDGGSRPQTPGHDGGSRPQTPGGKLMAKVVDFGLAHVDDARDQGPTLTSRDVIAGTPEYMSPEQCRSLIVSPSADLYSIGCILTEMLQLRPPFTGGSAIEVLAKQMFTQPPPLARPASAEPVPPLLERLRLDLLSKSPDKRPRDAADVKARLYEAMSAEATLARLPTRKGDEPLGDRAERAPHWDTGETVPPTTRTRPRSVGLLRLGPPTPGGIGDELETGLAAHKLETVPVRDIAGVASGSLGVLVIDAGSLVDEAARSVTELRLASPRCRAVVCAADLTTERMNALVAAGAADVLRYPVTADTLARKIDRVIRRGR